MAASPDSPVMELQAVLNRYPHEFDEPESIRFIAAVREKGLLEDEEWRRILASCDHAMSFIAEQAVDSEDDEENIDADPRNADWIRVVRAKRYAGYQIANWAALWLWQIGHNRDADRWWPQIGEVAREFGCPGFDPYRSRSLLVQSANCEALPLRL